MVDPVRWATPGTEVVCARYPECSARSTIQSARTPPPSPPIARIAIEIALGARLWSDAGGAAAPFAIKTSRPRQAWIPARRRSMRFCKNPITALRTFDFVRSHAFGLVITSARKNDGHRTAACATSPHRPHPEQLSRTVATGSFRNGSWLGLMVSDGQPD